MKRMPTNTAGERSATMIKGTFSTSRAASLAALAMMIVVALVPSTAAASVPSYAYQGTFSTGDDPVYPFGPCTVHDLEVDSQENVYVLCGGEADRNFSSGAIIKKFDKNGNPVPWAYNAPYITANAIIKNPHPDAPEWDENYGPTFVGQDEIAIDKSGGATDGYIFVNHSPGLQIFEPSGRWVGNIFGGFDSGLDVGPTGNIFWDAGGRVQIFNPSWTWVKQINFLGEGGEYNVIFGEQGVATDSTGAVWGIGKPLEDAQVRTVSKYEADQYTEPEIERAFSIGKRRKAKSSPYVDVPLKPFGSANPLFAASLAVDLDDDSLYLLRAEPRGILHFSPGTPDEEAHQLSGVIGTAAHVGGGFCGIGSRSCDDGLGFGQDSKILYVAKEAGVSKFVPGPPVPKVVTKPAEIDDVGHTSATVRGEVLLDGGGPITECAVKYGPTKNFGSTVPCTPDPASAAPGSNFTVDTSVSVELSGLSVGSSYHYAFVAKNVDGEGLGANRNLRAAAVLGLRTLPATEVTDESATLQGTLDPDGMETTYYFEYGLRGEFSQKTPVSSPLSGSGEEPVSVAVSDLKAGGDYSYRIVARNSLGVSTGPTQTFTVAGPPKVFGVRATDVAESEATLSARVNPGGYATTYRFEYGTTPDYGSTIPIAPVETSVGDGVSFASASEHLTGLMPGVTYHFRLIATNEWGSTASGDTTFYFYPQACPNERVRQITRSSFLPDCRAYELVSPADAGSVQIYPGNELYDAETFLGGNTNLMYRHSIQNTGLAQSPPRFMFYGGLGVVEGLDAPNIALDAYLATRTNQGWATRFPGFKGNEVGKPGRIVCSSSLAFCLAHVTNPPVGQFANPTIDNTGYLFDSGGEMVGLLPSNVKSVPNGEDFTGDWQPSPNFDHLAFSSSDVAFAPGGLTAAPGSAYDNDIEDHSISVISRVPNGDPIGSATGDTQEFITFPPRGISEDGSHILMRTRAPDGPSALYMRVNNALSYEISQGAGVRLIGMTADGSKVLFHANQQLSAADTDDSSDIYMWKENGGTPTLTVLSQGNGEGDTDSCDASWTVRCSAQVLTTERGDRTGFTPGPYTNVMLPGIDSGLGGGSGAVYFFSPESLDKGVPGNAKNLYLARDGEVHYVTTLKSAETIDRIQISPDGRYAGFLTRSQLTPYDNDGFKEMYAYDAFTDSLTCASCVPSGEAPTFDVEASQNGPFMTDDGRVFFATSDPLVRGDVDAYNLPDVYEYVENRPQLISSGVSTTARAPGGGATFATELLGLESVSADGTDVYFSTTDSLAPQDQNGRSAKIYDARTNGGFEPPETETPCVAADECHDTGAATPGALPVGTGSVTFGGNLTAQKRHRKRCARKAKQAAGKKVRACPRKSRKAR
jgi:hypothetical protein